MLYVTFKRGHNIEPQTRKEEKEKEKTTKKDFWN